MIRGVSTRDFSAVTQRLQQAIDRVERAPQAADPRALIQSVQSQIDAIARGDLDAVLAHALPDVTLNIFVPPEFPWIRQARGIDDLRRALDHNFGSLDDQRPVVTDVFAEGNTVVLFGREQGRIRETGQHYDVEFVERFKFEDGRLSGVRIIGAHVESGD
jgi:ketosteroid isomerase-like protein